MRYFNADYRVRLPAEKVLAAAQSALGVAVVGSTLLLPLTRFLRIVRGLALHGVDSSYALAELLPITAFCAVVLSMSLWACGRMLRGNSA